MRGTAPAESDRFGVFGGRYVPETLESNQATYETEQAIHAAAAVRSMLD